MKHIGFYKISNLEFGRILPIFNDGSDNRTALLDKSFKVLSYPKIDNYNKKSVFVLGETITKAPAIGDFGILAYQYGEKSICIGEYHLFCKNLRDLLNESALDHLPFCALEAALFIGDEQTAKTYSIKCYHALKKENMKIAESWIKYAEIPENIKSSISDEILITDEDTYTPISILAPDYYFHILDYAVRYFGYNSRTNLIRDAFNFAEKDAYNYEINHEQYTHINKNIVHIRNIFENLAEKKFDQNSHFSILDINRSISLRVYNREYRHSNKLLNKFYRQIIFEKELHFSQNNYDIRNLYFLRGGSKSSIMACVVIFFIMAKSQSFFADYIQNANIQGRITNRQYYYRF